MSKGVFVSSCFVYASNCVCVLCDNMHAFASSLPTHPAFALILARSHSYTIDLPLATRALSRVLSAAAVDLFTLTLRSSALITRAGTGLLLEPS